MIRVKVDAMKSPGAGFSYLANIKDGVSSPTTVYLVTGIQQKSRPDGLGRHVVALANVSCDNPRCVARYYLKPFYGSVTLTSDGEDDG